ncbi:hypothetical protein JCM8097_006434 [Rhodosporidiobolus ruineniae]
MTTLAAAAPSYWSPAPLVVDDKPVSFNLPFLLPSPPSSTSPDSFAPSATPSAPIASTSSSRKTTRKSSTSKAAADKPRRAPPKRLNPPRPPNAWICYRSARVQELKGTAQYAKLPQADVSKIIGELWRNESAEVRAQYEELAKVKKAEHKEKHPDYAFRPVRRKASKPLPTPLKAAVAPPAAHPVLGMPSVLLPPPISQHFPSHDLELPTPPSSCQMSARTLSNSSSSRPSTSSYEYQPDLRVSPLLPYPPTFDDWTPTSLGLQLPPTPAWSAYEPSSFSPVSPSQLAQPGPLDFSPTLDHAIAFLSSAYPTPPASAVEPVFDLDQMWASATVGGEFLELPVPF